jgi:hypothetical protein
MYCMWYRTFWWIRKEKVIDIMVSLLYWINPYGKILKQHNTTHIQSIVNKPDVFGVDKEWIESVYKKYNEPIGTEGRSREEIIDYVLKTGFIRVRLYTNKYWSITLSNFRNRRTKKALSKWAEEASKEKSSGKHMPVRILDVKTDKLYQEWTVNDIKFDKHLSESDDQEGMELFTPVFVEELEELKQNNLTTFRSYYSTVKER